MNNNKYLTTTALFSALVLGSFSAIAEENISKTLDELKAKVAKLESEMPCHKHDKKGHVTHQGKVKHHDAVLHTKQHGNPSKEHWVDQIKVSIVPNPKIESANGANTLNINAFAQSDWAFYSKDKAIYNAQGNITQPKHRSGSTLRNARISISGIFAKDWGYRFENNFAGANNSAATTAGSVSYNKITDAFIAYNGIEHVNIRAGQFLESVVLDNLVSFKHLTFSEPAAIAAFAPARHLGIAATLYHKFGTLTLGGFGNNSASGNSGESQNSGSARLTLLPINEAGNLVHLAASTSVARPERFSDNSKAGLAYSYKPATAISRALISKSFANVAHNQLVGYEAILAHKNISLVGEYLTNTIKTVGNPANKFKGYYMQAGWIITGETRGYDARTGVLTTVAPLHPFCLKSGTWAAWEIATRYNLLDLNDKKNQLLLGKVKEYNLALNWYVNNNIKLHAEYTKVKSDLNTKPVQDKPSIYVLRAQFAL